MAESGRRMNCLEKLVDTCRVERFLGRISSSRVFIRV